MVNFAHRQWDQIEGVIEEILELNPTCTDHMLRNWQIRRDGGLGTWDLRGCGLVALPESFGHLTLGGSLFLCQNNLQALPDSMGSLKVSGYMTLSSNQLTRLPRSFGEVHIRGDLWLCDNQLSSWPVFKNVGGVVRR
eukprot:TRINITY_DN24492_c0_g1_i1.p2 TRINITY_DN24492_c0_g1~~TRINITY_DN24492_c0_g1_i1.p2  ORF type:complete len:137 (-),score=31.79 TRINITY_DN24492_c0_g1_i1:237-647(-)